MIEFVSAREAPDHDIIMRVRGSGIMSWLGIYPRGEFEVRGSVVSWYFYPGGGRCSDFFMSMQLHDLAKVAEWQKEKQ